MTKAQSRTPPPEGLAGNALVFWSESVRAYRFTAVELHSLREAAFALQRADQARQILDREGLVVAGHRGPVPHPAVAIERASRQQFHTIAGKLGLMAGGRAS